MTKHIPLASSRCDNAGKQITWWIIGVSILIITALWYYAEDIIDCFRRLLAYRLG